MFIWQKNVLLQDSVDVLSGAMRHLFQVTDVHDAVASLRESYGISGSINDSFRTFKMRYLLAISYNALARFQISSEQIQNIRN